jgi:DNA-binding MarR family transcriptional regulator
MDFYNQIGKMVIGSRLRLLTDKITIDAGQVYKLYEADLQPKWFPVFHRLSTGDSTITAIASEIGHSHPSVSKIVSEMIKKGMVIEKKDATDKRRTTVGLSAKGKKTAEKIRTLYTDVTNAVEGMLSRSRNDLWKAIEEWEFLLNEKSLLKRVQEEKKQRESKEVKIVPFQSKYAAAFKALNEAWISQYFEIEEEDQRALDNPKKGILDKGGFIFVALLNKEPVGVCALKTMDDPVYKYELAKMAVRSDMQGKNIGWLLGQAVITKAKSLRADAIYLESNTILKPAISLYQKMGFKKIVGHATPYKRCNIQMELVLK